VNEAAAGGDIGTILDRLSEEVQAVRDEQSYWYNILALCEDGIIDPEKHRTKCERAKEHVKSIEDRQKAKKRLEQ